MILNAVSTGLSEFDSDSIFGLRSSDPQNANVVCGTPDMLSGSQPTVLGRSLHTCSDRDGFNGQHTSIWRYAAECGMAPMLGHDMGGANVWGRFLPNKVAGL